MSHVTRTSRRGLRVALLAQVSAWIGVLCLVAQLSTALHFVLVAHVVCPEHGGWSHADAHEPHAQQAAPVGEAGRAQLVEDHGSAEHEHEHCAVVTERRALVAVVSQSAVVVLPAAALDASSDPGTADRVSARRAYVVAPKTSPPV